MPSREAKSAIFGKIGYEPHPPQAEFHFAESRIKQLIGGERAGKSVCASRELTSQFWLGELYWLVGVDYEICRPEFTYLVDDFTKLGILKKNELHFPSRDQCIMVVSPGIRIETKSAKYPEKLAARAPDGIIMCEAAQVPYEIFLRCIGRLAEKRGWLVMAGTLETSLDWYSNKFKEYQVPDNKEGGISFSIPSWTNTEIYPEGKNDLEIQRLEMMLGQDRFDERIGGKPVKPKGLVFPEFKSTLHTGRFPYTPKEPVYLGVDVGWNPGVYAVEFIQYLDDHIYVFDEIYEQFLNTDEIIAIVKKKMLGKQFGGGGMCLGAWQHQGQKPVHEMWRSAGFSLSSRKIPIQDGNDRLRTFLNPYPRTDETQLHINERCRGLISEFGGCLSPVEGGGMYKMKMTRTGEVLSETPEDESNHAIKALIYSVTARYGLVQRNRSPLVSYPKMR